ncbi:MAG: alpha/beta hydrolase [Oligoflexia bacterium]|nr:alpha/beta hydrolase [Oligoflexia bacterium]
MNPILHFSKSGSEAAQAPWLVFLHGLMGSLANWRKITPAFESNFKILTVDQRGHGKSFKPKTGFAPEDFADDLRALFDHLGIKQANLVGHSMGGRNALCFSSLYPDRVVRLVIEDISPEGINKLGGGLARLLRAVPTPFETKAKAKSYFMNELGDPKLGMFLYTSITETPDGKADWVVPMNGILEALESAAHHSRWEELKSLKCPTLVIRGESSRELSREDFGRMMKENSKVQGIEIQGAGHWVHFDRPLEFIEALRKFLSSL